MDSKQYICKLFNSFCIKVLRDEACDHYKKINCIIKCESSMTLKKLLNKITYDKKLK